MGQSLCPQRSECWTEPAVKPGHFLSLIAAAEGERGTLETCWQQECCLMPGERGHTVLRCTETLSAGILQGSIVCET